jgi:hypothetical protein
MNGTYGVAIVSLLMAFGITADASGADNFLQKSVTWIVQGGVFRGSIVGRNKIDAVTGATKTAFSGAAATEFNIKGHYLQVGANIGQTSQTVEYHDASKGIDGTRDISLLLLDLPLIYNFHLFTDHSGGHNTPRLVLGLGGFSSFVLSRRIDESGAVGNASMSSWAMGPFLRAAAYPYALNRFQPGLFFDFYRSFVPQFYDDAYFKANSIAGQLGIINFGLSIRY